MHLNWNDILTLVFSLLGGIAVMFVSFSIGWFRRGVVAEKTLANEIIRIRREYANKNAIDGFDANESLNTAIRTQTIKDCMRLV